MNSIVYNSDCLEAMKLMPDKAFELAIVDPPYGIGNFSQSDSTEDVNWNDAIPNPEYFSELIRVSKKRIIWGANYYSCFEQGNGALVWYKNIGHTSMSHCEIASVSGQKKVDFVHINWSGGIRSQQNDFCHPCQKPLTIYRYCLKNYAKQGDKILDTHLGSGSSRIACHEMGFDFTGYELDKDYYEAQEKRFQKYLSQEKLFVPEKQILTTESLF